MLARSLYKLFGSSVRSTSFDFKPVSSVAVLKSKNYFHLLQTTTSSTLKKKPDLLFWNPNNLILPSFVNKRIALHNGRFFKIFQVKLSMVFVRVGNLIRTKKLGASIHILKKKKKRK